MSRTDEKAKWLWSALPGGCVSALSGPSGTTNSLVAAWIASEILRRGEPLSGGHRIADPTRQIMWLDRLDGYARLLDHVKALKTPPGIFWPVERGEDDFPLLDMTQDRTLELVADVAAETKPIWVVVADGLLRSEPPHAMARACNAMAELAREVGCAVTFLLEASPEPVRAGGWTDVANKMATIVSVWAAGSQDLRLSASKTDGKRPAPLRIRIEDGIPRVVPQHATPKAAFDRATAHLRQELGAGPQPAARLIAAAKMDHGISKRSLERGKKALQIRVFQASRRWWWALP